MVTQLANIAKSFYSKDTNIRFLYLLLIGLLIRVIVMPFFGHMDVLSEARRVYFWIENDLYFDNISRNTTMLIEVIFLKLTHFLLPDYHAMLKFDDIAHTTATIPHAFEFVSHPSIFRTLFVLKLPYLVFDLLTAFVLYNFFDDKTKGLNSCKIWLFNPITIFAFYIYGRFESIPIFFIAAGILALKNKRYLLSAILVGLCLNGREMMIMYSPLFIVAIIFSYNNSISITKKIICCLIVFGFTAVALQLYSFVMPQIQNAVGGNVGTLMHEGRVRYLFDFRVQNIIMIPFTYALILIYLSTNQASSHVKLLLACSLAIMSFFAFCSHSAHFASWMVVFPAIFYGYNKKFFMPFMAVCVSWFCYWLVLTDLGVFTTWLASAYSLHFIGVPSIPTYLKEFAAELGLFNRTMLVHLAQTAWVASLAYMGGMMILQTKHNTDD